MWQVYHWYLTSVPWDYHRSHLEIQLTIPVHVNSIISHDSASPDLRAFSDHKSMSSPHLGGQSGGELMPQKQALTTEGQEFFHQPDSSLYQETILKVGLHSVAHDSHEV